MTTEPAGPDLFDRIHREFDDTPPESWTEDEARLVLLVLEAIRRGRQPKHPRLDFRPGGLQKYHYN
ncbi:hypothetical protein [Mycobacterium sp. pW045]|uniref:hypothetical protein n=1 Tax=Mycobacterium sp. pW045 TaxID=3238984 RepID=UPI00351AB154